MNKAFQLNSYFYELPESLIAQHPLTKRDLARLMIVDRKSQRIYHDLFKNIHQYLPSKTNFVVNNTKVIPARLLGSKSDTGGHIEIFLLKELDNKGSFEALLKPLKKIKEGQILDFGKGLKAQLIDKERRIVQFNKKNVLKVIETQGHIPLPPYIKREDNASDRKDYQTVYAKNLGSVAAPTAGLHFTNTLVNRLKLQGHQFMQLTLHIGYGTFKPVEASDIRSHIMHTEIYEMPNRTHQKILKFKSQNRPICAVGTTSCRVLETIGKGASLMGETNLFA